MSFITDINRKALLGQIMDQSYQVSLFAPPMKPFIRFMPGESEALIRFYWDFDDLLQARLWNLICEIAAPGLVETMVTERWGDNMHASLERRRRQLRHAQDQGIQIEMESRTAHIEFAASRLKPGARLMLVGAGTGPACFEFNRLGIQTVGIDPLVDLLIVGREWADYLQRPIQFVGMDVARLAFKPQSFDSFYLGIYGYLSTLEQNQALQRGMARLLKPGGIGFVTSIRKKYTSHWYKMGHPYSSRLTVWLLPQTALDFHYSDPDGRTERLRYGLFHCAHSVESLRAELEYAFEVIECGYDSDDPRYVTAVVQAKADLPTGPSLPDLTQPDPSLSIERWEAITAEVQQITDVCDELTRHAERVMACFCDPEFRSPGECFRQLMPQITPFINGLQQVFGQDR